MKDVPLMMEHLDTQEEYKLAADYIREVGRKNGILVPGSQFSVDLSIKFVCEWELCRFSIGSLYTSG